VLGWIIFASIDQEVDLYGFIFSKDDGFWGVLCFQTAELG